MAGCPTCFSKPTWNIISTVKGFAHRVRIGYYGQGRRVKAGTVQLAISAIGATLVLEEHAIRNPLKELDGKNLILPLRYLLQAYRNTDPAVKKELAVPVELVIEAQQLLKPKSVKFRRVAQLMMIAFFYLLRVGEYTKPRKRTRTVQFRVKDVLFWKDQIAIAPLTAAEEDFIGIQAGTLRIENQKNGIRNQTVHHEALVLPNDGCPVDTLIEVVKDLRKDKAVDTSLLCAYKIGNNWHHVTAQQITRSVKWVASKIGLIDRGFPTDRIGSHSLRAGGATAMKLNRIDDMLIKKYGRWSSDTFLTYIHEQIAGLADGISAAMATQIKFYNVAGYGP